MSKFFMYGSELQELEQLMMLVPNFFPRRSGVIVVQRIRNETEPLEFERSSDLITEYCRSNSSSKFSDQIAAGEINYDEVIKKMLRKMRIQSS